jgi:nicotinic acid mononucleotide adenylyltransferase
VLCLFSLCSLLVFEQARNYLQFEQNRYDVIGGWLSPVHDAYGKASLIPQKQRYDMCVAAVSSSVWLSVQQWEMKQKGWTTTAETLCKYQEALNSANLTHGQRQSAEESATLQMMMLNFEILVFLFQIRFA